MAKIGLQLYSIKEDCAEDFLGAIAKVAEIGYDGVEFAGYYDTPADTLKQHLADHNIAAAGTHIGVPALENELGDVIDYADAIGCPAVINPGFRIDESDPVGTVNHIAELFNRAGAACHASGQRFMYHIHGHEFKPVDGDKTGMQILLENTDPELVWLEPDVMWVEHGGVDAVQFLKAHGDRCAYLHLKDYIDRESWRDTEVGNGAIDMPGIMAVAKTLDIPWYIVEQEAFDKPRLESIAICLQNVRQLMA